MVHMLTGATSCGEVDGNEKKVALAIRRLRSFRFAGLTDKWALSMCLGHRMFGGRCLLRDFMNTGVTIGASQSKQVLLEETKHSISVLHGWRDPYDGPLYEAATERFAQDCQRYGVSVGSCQPCFQEAGVEVHDDAV